MAQWYEAIHTSKRFRLGTIKTAANGNQYIYLKGVASLAQYDWVAFDELFATERLVAASIGGVGIAQAAVDATTKFGWFLIWGSGSGKCEAGYADNGVVMSPGVAGSVDDASLAAAETQVFGAWGRSAISGSTATFQLQHPYKSIATLD